MKIKHINAIRIELHLNGQFWDSAESRPDKIKWQEKEMKAKWQKEIAEADVWEIYHVHTPIE
jgi:hypothetical protein